MNFACSFTFAFYWCPEVSYIVHISNSAFIIRCWVFSVPFIIQIHSSLDVWCSSFHSSFEFCIHHQVFGIHRSIHRSNFAFVIRCLVLIVLFIVQILNFHLKFGIRHFIRHSIHRLNFPYILYKHDKDRMVLSQRCLGNPRLKKSKNDYVVGHC